MTAKQTITTPSTFMNLGPSELIERSLRAGEGSLASNGSLVVTTGKRTGRSPADRYIVQEPSTADMIDWGAVNRPFDSDKFDALWEKVETFNDGQDRYVSEVHVGADPEHYIPLRVTTETAWQNLFGRNMFVRPEKYNAKSKEEWQVPNDPGVDCETDRDGTNSDG